MQRLDLRQDGASVLAVVETCIPQFLLQAHARVFGDLKQGKRTILMHKVSLLVDALSPVNHKDVDQGLKHKLDLSPSCSVYKLLHHKIL